MSGKYSPGMLAMRQKLLEHDKQSAKDALKTSSERVIQKTVTGDWIVNNIDNRITKVSKSLQQINSETATNEHNKEIPKEKYVSPEKTQEIIDLV